MGMSVSDINQVSAEIYVNILQMAIITIVLLFSAYAQTMHKSRQRKGGPKVLVEWQETGEREWRNKDLV